MRPAKRNKLPIRRPLATMSTLNLLLLILPLALTSFVCANRIQAEDECLASKVLCYECDSRHNPECADPFRFSIAAYLELANKQAGSQVKPSSPLLNSSTTNEPSSAIIPVSSSQQPANRLPPAAITCHGCCVKITSKTPDGMFVRRTCTTNLQINYFMVGLVCMNESGDRGKMCFCESDYCNGTSRILPVKIHYAILITILSTLFILKKYTFRD